MAALPALHEELDRLSSQGRRRRLIPRTGADFSSNDYLCLAGSARLADAVAEAVARGVPVGSGGSRLLRGNHEEHEALEEDAARFFGTESALYFANGYAANTALFSTLPQKGDLVVHDSLIHASAHDGMRLGRAEYVSVAHNDADAFSDAISAWRTAGGRGRPWIAVESLYSMDGDRAPLGDLVAIADHHDAVLLIDEAHATGVFGRDGRGLADGLDGRENVITLRTCGKALGCEGALVCGPMVVRDFLINRARPFVFSTAPSPLMASLVREALHILVDEPERRGRLAALIADAELALVACGVKPTNSQILPLIIGPDNEAVRIAGLLQRHGFDVRAIRPPTVPVGSARLRISLTPERHSGRCRGAGGRARGRAPMSGPVIVVTGTDTDVGKTVFSAGLAGALDGYYWKPVQAGLDGGTDAARVAALSGLSPERVLPEAYRLTTPCSPHRAAELVGIEIDPDRLALPSVDRPLIVEGAGGVLVPLTPRLLYADLVASWRRPTVLVARTTLGTINHSLLSIEALRRRGVPILGVAFVGDAVEDSEATICRMGTVPPAWPAAAARTAGPCNTQWSVRCCL